MSQMISVIKHNYLSSLEFEKTTTRKYVFHTMNIYFNTNGLCWKSCVGVCTDGVPSMVGTIKALVSYTKKENENTLITHCFIIVNHSLERQ